MNLILFKDENLTFKKNRKKSGVGNDPKKEEKKIFLAQIWKNLERFQGKEEHSNVDRGDSKPDGIN